MLLGLGLGFFFPGNHCKRHWEIKSIVHGTLKCCQGNSAVTLQLVGLLQDRKMWGSWPPKQGELHPPAHIVPGLSHEEEEFLGCSHEGNRESRAHLGVCGGARGTHGCCSQH